jgi:hypothetical protein
MAWIGDGRGTLSVQTAAPAVRITGIKVLATVLAAGLTSPFRRSANIFPD